MVERRQRSRGFWEFPGKPADKHLIPALWPAYQHCLHSLNLIRYSPAPGGRAEDGENDEMAVLRELKVILHERSCSPSWFRSGDFFKLQGVLDEGGGLPGLPGP